MSSAEPLRPSKRTWILPVLAGVFALLHIFVVASIAQQEFLVNEAAPQTRSLIWPLHNDTIHRQGPGADFFAVYHAGACEKVGLDPYVWPPPQARTPYLYQFRYLPIVGQSLGAWFQGLMPLTAYRVWVVVLDLMLFGLIAVFWLRRSSNGQAWFSTLVLLASSPFLLELHLGQFTFATVALVAVYLLLTSDDRHLLKASPLYVVATLLKIFPVIVVPALLRTRRAWPVIGFAVVAVVLLSLPYFAAYPERWQAFYQANFAHGPMGMDSGNHGFVYLVALAVRDSGGSLESAGFEFFVQAWRVAVTGLTAVVVLVSRSRSILLGASALLLAHFLSYSQVWEHHYSGVVVVGLLLLRHFTAVSGGFDVRAKVVMAGLVLLALPTPFGIFDVAKDFRAFDPTESWAAWWRYCVPACKALPTALLFGLSLYALWRAGFALPWHTERTNGSS